MKKRILSLLICLALVFSMMPVNTLQVHAAANVIEKIMKNDEGILITAADLGVPDAGRETIEYKWSIVKDGTDYTTKEINGKPLVASQQDKFGVLPVDGNCVLDGATISLTMKDQKGAEVVWDTTVLLRVMHTPLIVMGSRDNIWFAGEEQHYHVCKGCGAEYGHADHEPGDWIVDKEATEKEAGSQHKECTVCGKVTETEEIARLECTHTIPRDDWSYSAKYHYHLCICGRSNMDAEIHTAGDWILDKEATAEENGIRHKECTVCGYKMKEETIEYEASVISSISVNNVAIPKEGETIDEVENTPTSMTYGGQYQLSSIEFDVYNEETETWDEVSEEDVFAKNTSYRMKIWLAAATGYNFAADIADEDIKVNGEAATLAEITDDKKYAAVYKEFRYECEHSFTERIKDDEHLVEGSGSDCTELYQYYYGCEYCDVISSEDIWTSDTYGPHNLDDKNYCDICEATIYDVWVGNTQINSKNAKDVFGDQTVSYNPETNVLTLNGYNNDGKAYEFEEECFAAIYSEEALNLQISGENEISNVEGTTEDDELFGIMSFEGDVTISGEGNLDVESLMVIVANRGDVVINGGTLKIEGDHGIFGNKVQIKGGDITIETSDMCTIVYGERSTLEVTGGNVRLSTYNTGSFVWNVAEEGYRAPDLSGYKGYIGRALVADRSRLRMLRPEIWEEYNPERLENYSAIELIKIPDEQVISAVEIGNIDIPKIGETLEDVEDAWETATYGGNYEICELGWYRCVEGGDEESLGYDEPLQADTKYLISLTVETNCEWGFPTDLKQENVTINGLEVDEIYGDNRYLSMYMTFYPERVRTEIDEIPDLIYTGKAQKPKFNVYHNDVLLKEGKDYTLTYVNNKNANAIGEGGIRMVKAGDGVFGSMTEDGFNPALPYVVIKGKTNYQKDIYVNFNITAPVIGDGSAKEAEGVVLKYTDHTEGNGKLFKPFSSIKYGSISMKSGVDYEVKVATPDAPETNLLNSKGQMKALEGTYIMTITGLGNFEGEIVKTIHIAAKPQLLKNAKIKLNVKSKEFDYLDSEGDKTTLSDGDYAVTIKDGTVTKELVKDTDYTVSYRNNDRLGSATLVLTGKGSYVGTKTITFKITGTKLTTKNVEIANVSDMDYTGMNIEQDAKLTLTKADGSKVDLIPETDYTVTYKNNLKKGTATITFTGSGLAGYAGSLKKTFQIKAVNLTDSMVGPIWRVSYTKAGATIDEYITLRHNGIKLVKGKDYTLKYKDNKDLGDATVIITGKGNFKGTLTKTFEIVEQHIGNMQITVKPMPFKAKEGHQYKLSVVVKDGKSTLKKGNDYTVDFVNPSKADLEAWYAGDESKAPMVTIKGAEGSCYYGSRNVPVTIYNCKLSSNNAYVKVDDSTNIYNGKQQLPKIEVYYSSDKAVIKELKAAEKKGTLNTVIEEKLAAGKLVWLEPERDYTVSGGANIFAGLNKGTVKATGTGVYSGSISAKFTIQKKDIWWFE